MQYTAHVFIFWLITLCAFPACAQDLIHIDMGADWFRRDWDKCRENVTGTHKNGVFTIDSDHAAALFWQVPTRQNHALAIDRNQDWIKDCDRPPRDFDNDVKKMVGDSNALFSVSEYPYISWKWRISNTIDDAETANDKGEIRQRGDDFAAKIGVSILTEKDDLREIAYVWTRSIPEETALTQVTTVAWFFKFKWYRIVAQSGNAHLNTWVSESRNLYEDFKRFYPKEEPREVVRIYLMSDSDNTDSKVTGAFTDIAFHKKPPADYVKAR